MSVSKVFMICNAYEAGFGKGLDASNDKNPYSEGTEEHEAWGVGYKEGYYRAVRDEEERPVVVCLCGSTRHKAAFEEAVMAETLAGKIVLSVGMYAHADNIDLDMAGPVKRCLDRLHFRKIEMADEVLILNVGGRIGLSTCDELHYAQALGKRVRFLESVGCQE